MTMTKICSRKASYTCGHGLFQMNKSSTNVEQMLVKSCPIIVQFFLDRPMFARRATIASPNDGKVRFFEQVIDLDKSLASLLTGTRKLRSCLVDMVGIIGCAASYPLLAHSCSLARCFVCSFLLLLSPCRNLDPSL